MCMNSCDAFLQNSPKAFSICKTLSSPYHPLKTNAQNKRTRPLATTVILDAAKRRGAMSRKKKDNAASSGGFGDAAAPLPETSTIKTKSGSPVGRVYSRPELYDLAVGYRDYEEEVQFLLNAHAKYSLGSGIGGGIGGDGDGPLNILELAAGPARHCVTALQYFGTNVNKCTAVDTSNDMVNYSNIEIADEELGKKGDDLRGRFNYINADMRTIGLETNRQSGLQEKSFDCAWILLGSLQHLTTNDDVISCFKSTANLLCDGGTMIIELPHPKETFAMGECTRNGWEVPLQGEDGEQYGELKIIWGDDDDVFDPIRQVRDFTIVMDLVETKGKNEKKSDNPAIREVVPTRLFTAQEIDALGRVAGFEVAHMYGALEEEEIDINNEEEAFRLICVMRKSFKA